MIPQVFRDEERLLESCKIILDGIKKPPKNEQELYAFIFALTGDPIPFVQVCQNHQTPWEMIWRAYKMDLPEYRDKCKKNMIAIGAREGLKTTSLAKLIAAELLLKKGVEQAAVGSTKTQAHRCYRFMSSHLRHPILSEMSTVVRNTLEETVLTNHSRCEQLVGTVDGVNSPHPNKLRADEVELMDPLVIEESKMVASTYGGIQSHSLFCSSRKWVDGNMSQLIEDADDANYDILVWCYKEVSEPCPDERSGKAEKTYEVDDMYHPGDTVIINAYEHCGQCPLLPSCRGDLKRSGGIVPIDDSIDKWGKLDRETWIAQKECGEPPMTNRFFSDWDEGTQVGEFPYNKNLPLDMSIDFSGGGDDPASIGFWQTDEDKDIDYRIDELIFYRKPTQKMGREIIQHVRENGYKLRYMIGDSSQAQQIMDLKDYFPFFEKLRGVRKIPRKEGLRVCKKRVRDNEGVRRLMVDERCRNFRKEIKNAKRSRTDRDDMRDRDDHSLDDWRYYAVEIHHHGGGEPRIRFLSPGAASEEEAPAEEMKPKQISVKEPDIWEAALREMALDDD